MAKLASEVVKQAQEWVGLKESDGSFKKIIDLYNSYLPHPRGYILKTSDEWCAATISAIAIKLGYTDIIPVECSCNKMIKLFKELGCWIEDESSVTPAPGWICFYDWQDDNKGDNKGVADHVGVVEWVQDGKFIVIEGNYNEAVKRRTVDIDGKYLRGFAAPKYDKESTKPSNDKISVVYQVWDDTQNRWLPNVADLTDYAGVYNHAVCAVYANLSKGNIFYKVHTKGGKWLPEVKNRTDYAGLYNKKIDGLMMRTDTGKTIHYAVHLRAKNRWLPFVTGYNEKDFNNGYAGILGQEIDAIKIYID